MHCDGLSFYQRSVDFNLVFHKPVSQWVPVNPSKHAQVYPLMTSEQTAEFWQGEEEHSCKSEKNIV